jgi:hypothetical protein
MPRRNKRKAATEPQKHAPSPFSRGYKQPCSGCAFAGYGLVCLTSDGNCLKVPLLDSKEADHAEIERRTNTASTER